MTTQEQINYVRFNIRNTDEALQLFDIVNQKEEEGARRAEVACAIIQMVGNKVNKLPAGFPERVEFKALMKTVQQNADSLSTKSVCDTLYSLGKFKVLPAGVYFTFVLGDLLKTATARVACMEPLEAAYLTKGLTKLRKSGALKDLSVLEQ